MKLKNFSFILFPLMLLSAVFFASCDDSGVSTPPAGEKPDIQFKPGSVYYFRNDSISQNGTYHATRWLTKDSILNAATYQGKSCFPVRSVTRDSSGPIIRSVTDYYSYTQTEGIFYQWGARNTIDPTQPPEWDKIADFTQTSEVLLYTIDTLFGQPTVSANVYSTVAGKTVTPLVSVNCYRIAVRAEIRLGTIVIGNVNIDYYIGYASSATNPSGRVGTKIYPVSLTGYPAADGADQRLISFTIAP